MIPVKLDISFDEDRATGGDKRRSSKSKEKINKSEMSRRNRAGDTLSDDSSASVSETFNAEKKVKFFRRGHKGRSRRTVTAKKFGTSSKGQ